MLSVLIAVITDKCFFSYQEREAINRQVCFSVAPGGCEIDVFPVAKITHSFGKQI